MSMNIDFQFRSKIPVGVLGATGRVGQKFVELLLNHPWFSLTALAASEQSVGKKYKEAVDWQMETPLPVEIGEMRIEPCKPLLACTIVFSAVDGAVAAPIETEFANAGYYVVSNTRAHRMDLDVPLLVPEVNSQHLSLLEKQHFAKKGYIVTDPNCSVIGLVIALKPLLDRFGLEAVHVSTLQAISGAGNGAKEVQQAIQDNVIPYIKDEEEKMETEPLKILGQPEKPLSITISAHCNRVPVSDGHLENVSVRLTKKTSPEEIISAWENFQGEPQILKLPSAPEYPIHYFMQDDFPQPKLHRNLERGMAVSVGRLRVCPNFGYKFSILSHNTIRGAAGAAILNAELMVKRGLIFW